MKAAPFDAIYSSDLIRASETARIAFGDRFQILLDKRLRELDDGDFTRHPVAEMQENELTYIDTSMPNGESYRDVEKRIRNFSEEMLRTRDGQHIAIVAHRFPQLSFEVICNGKSWPQALAEDWRKTKSWQPGWDYVVN